MRMEDTARVSRGFSENCSTQNSGVLAVDFSPNGFQLATGGMDNSVKLWDLRKRRRLENLYAFGIFFCYQIWTSVLLTKS